MSKKAVFFFVAVIFFLSSRVVYANLVINEVMYYPNNGDTDWAEIYNNGNSDIVIDTVGASDAWRISTSASDTPPKYNLNGSNFTIPAGGYVILACDKDTFLSNHQGFSGNVVDITAIGFNNSGGILKLWDNTGTAISVVSYGLSSDGASDTGNSLQLISGAWIGATPTPGAANSSSVASLSNSTPTGMSPLVNSGEDTTDSSSEASSRAAGKSNPTEFPIQTKITAPGLVFVGNPLTLEAASFGHSKEALHFGKYFWNFGDGDSKETQASDTPILSHTYFYPGDYVVSVEYYANPYLDIPDASDKIKITAMSADIAISKIGDDKDFFIELTNNTDYDVDISGWTLSASGKTFLSPKNTFISSKKKMTISPNLTRFSESDADTLKLYTPAGEVAFDYGASLLTKTVLVLAPIPAEEKPKDESPAQPVSEKEIPEKESLKSGAEALPPEEIPNEDLGASASSIAVKDDAISYPAVIAIVLVATAGGAVYFIRRRRTSLKIGEEFKILDE